MAVLLARTVRSQLYIDFFAFPIPPAVPLGAKPQSRYFDLRQIDARSPQEVARNAIALHWSLDNTPSGWPVNHVGPHVTTFKVNSVEKVLLVSSQ
jgi:hypothetical protein